MEVIAAANDQQTSFQMALSLEKETSFHYSDMAGAKVLSNP